MNYRIDDTAKCAHCGERIRLIQSTSWEADDAMNLIPGTVRLSEPFWIHDSSSARTFCQTTVAEPLYRT